MDNIESNRLQQLYSLAEKVPLSKRRAIAFVGSRTRLERLAAEKKIRAVKLAPNRQNGRWECNGADVLRYAKPKDL